MTIDIAKMSIKKKRVMKYFIEAARQLLLNEGPSSLSIRRIADIAGYNSATLYNYFEDLAHLSLYASMSYLREYVSALNRNVRPGMTSFEIYHIIYDTFDYYSFRAPEIFYNIFFGPQRSKLTEVIRTYYSLFPEELEGHNAAVRQMLTTGNMYLRDRPVVDELVKEGFIAAGNADLVANAIPRIQQTYLFEMLDASDRPTPEAQHKRFMEILDKILALAK